MFEFMTAAGCDTFPLWVETLKRTDILRDNVPTLQYLDVIVPRKKKERIIICEVGAEAEEICEHRASNIEVLSIVNPRDMDLQKIEF